MLKEEIRARLIEYSIYPDKPVVVGVSGGMDSMCLSSLLAGSGYRIVAVHFNHQIRPESDADADFVRGSMEGKGIEYQVGEADVPGYAAMNKMSVEAAAREKRYQFLFEVCENTNSQGVIVAHNADDQVETVLMNILRGAGLDGIEGMQEYQMPHQWSEVCPLVRPLLSVWRSEIQDYVQQNNIPYVEDKSNLDINYLRNRVRHELIPILHRYNPGVKSNLWKLSQIVGTDLRYLDSVTQANFDAITCEYDDSITVERRSFTALDISIQNRILILIFNRLVNSQQAYDFQQIIRVREFIHAHATGSQIDVGGGIIAQVENEHVRFYHVLTEIHYSQYPQISTDIIVEVPSNHMLNDRWRFSAQAVHLLTKDNPKISNIIDPNLVYLSVPKSAAILLRQRQKGDKIAPLGMNGRIMKVSDIMINQKIPKNARDQWPLLLIEGEIAWIPGLKISEKFRVDENTQEILKFHCFRDEI